MITVMLKGGLGNQMFQYALYRKLLSIKKDARLDFLPAVDGMKVLNRPTIFDSFVLTKDDQLSIPRYFWAKVKRKIQPLRQTVYREKTEGEFSPDVFSLNDVYLDGYWQSQAYFLDIRKELIDSFTLKGQLSRVSKKVFDLILHQKNSVSVHIRLGDYLTEDNQRLFGNICTSSYYNLAMEIMTERNPGCKFFVFSNEPKKARLLLPSFYDMTFVDCNENGDACVDLFLMCKCSHNIIANSSFSWWGAWLNENPKKTVIAPRIWMNNQTMPDICPSEWLRI